MFFKKIDYLKLECHPWIWETFSCGNPNKGKMKVETLSFAYLLALTLLKHSFKITSFVGKGRGDLNWEIAFIRLVHSFESFSSLFFNIGGHSPLWVMKSLRSELGLHKEAEFVTLFYFFVCLLIIVNENVQLDEIMQ